MLQWQETVLSVAVGLATLGRAIAPGQVMAGDPQPTVAAQEGAVAEVSAEGESDEVLYLLSEGSVDGDATDVTGAAVAQVTPPAEGAPAIVEGELIELQVSGEPAPGTAEETVRLTVSNADVADVAAVAAGAADVAAAGAKAGADAEAELRKEMEAAIARGDVSEFWIGLEAIAVDDALRAQLELPENQGLLVVSVVEGAPAEQAGLKRYDVVTAVNDKTVSELGSIGAIVKETKDAELTFKIIRAAKPITIAIKPAKRPLDRVAVWARSSNADEKATGLATTRYSVSLKDVAEGRTGQPENVQAYILALQGAAEGQAAKANILAKLGGLTTQASAEHAKLAEAHAALAQAEAKLAVDRAQHVAAGMKLDNVFVGTDPLVVPGQVFDGHHLAFSVPAANASAMVFSAGKPELPEGTSVTISHVNNAPTKVIVVQANKDGTIKQSIETTSDKLDVLPEELRKSVEPLLSQVTTMTGKIASDGKSGARNLTIRRVAPGMSGLRSPVAKWGFGQLPPGAHVVQGHAIAPGMMPPAAMPPGMPGAMRVMGMPLGGAETDKKIDDLSKQIEALTKAVNELEARLGAQGGK